MSVASEITRIQNAKASLKTSINAKTDTEHQITNETIDEYADFVDSITSGGGLDWSAIGYSDTPQTIIDGYNYALQIKNNWNTSQTSMQSMFTDDINLIFMPVVDISNINNMRATFWGCLNVMTIDFGDYTNNLITSFRSAFGYCKNLTEIDLSNFTTTSLTSTYQMFYGDVKLKKIDIRNFNFSNITEYTNMFGDSASSGVPNDCLIIVKDNTAKTWITSKFSRLTNVKTVEEYEGG